MIPWDPLLIVPLYDIHEDANIVAPIHKFLLNFLVDPLDNLKVYKSYHNKVLLLTY